MMENLNEQAVSAAARFLVRYGIDIIETNWKHGNASVDIVADDGGAIVFVDVAARDSAEKGMPSEDVEGSRECREISAGIWLAEHDDERFVDVPIRFDTIATMIISADRVFIRHHIGALSAALATRREAGAHDAAQPNPLLR